jgi:hypothetical protein
MERIEQHPLHLFIKEFIADSVLIKASSKKTNLYGTIIETKPHK